MDISAVIHAFNEEKQLPRLFESLKGIDDIVLIDHRSTDRTAEVATELGATVYTQDNPSEKILAKDVALFEERYGYKPIFQEGNDMPLHDIDRNETAKLAKNDWIFFPDADEIVTWDLDEIKKMLPGNDVIGCRFNHVRDAQGNVVDWYETIKLYDRRKAWWIDPMHCFITGYETQAIFTNRMVIDHYQIPRDYRATYLPSLEYFHLKRGDGRSAYYLATEYLSHHEFEKALKFYKTYLKTAFWDIEIAKVYMFMAICCYELGREHEGLAHCMQSIQKNPYALKPLLLMADMANSVRNAKMWRRFAEIVHEDDQKAMLA